MTDSATAQWITFLTMIVGFGLQIYRENRARRWAEEERAQLAAKVEANGKVQKSNHAEVTNAINDNTRISVEAFREANDVNRKIALMGVNIAGGNHADLGPS